MKKLTYEFVKEQIEKEGYKLLSKEYKNANSKLIVVCSDNHEYSVTYGHFYSGKRCSKCSYPSKKHSYEYIKEQIEKKGYKLLSEGYNGNREKLLIKCNKGHEFKLSFHKFITGTRCLVCAKNKKLEYSYIKEQIEKEGYELLSKEYINAHNKLQMKCNKGHICEITYSNFKQGKRCKVCDKEKRSGKQKHSYDYIKKKIENIGYKLLSKEYKNNWTKLRIECNKGHEYEVVYGHFQQGKRCPICDAMKTSSKAEKEIAEYLKYSNIDIIENDRTKIINPLTNKFLELDVFIPKLNKAIEFNGTYWHSLDKTIIKDKIKKEQCKKIGIDLLIIEEQDWMSDKNRCLNEINNFIG